MRSNRFRASLTAARSIFMRMLLLFQFGGVFKAEIRPQDAGNLLLIITDRGGDGYAEYPVEAGDIEVGHVGRTVLHWIDEPVPIGEVLMEVKFFIILGPVVGIEPTFRVIFIPLISVM